MAGDLQKKGMGKRTLCGSLVRLGLGFFLIAYFKFIKSNSCNCMI